VSLWDQILREIAENETERLESLLLSALEPGAITASASTKPLVFGDKELADMMERFRKIAAEPIVVGFAISPAMRAAIESQSRNTAANAYAGSLYAGVPFLIDPRITGQAEAYYSREAWQARCREQKQWDEGRKK
jgi:hypothetical protein